MKILDKYVVGHDTEWKVQSVSGEKYLVRVSDIGIWTCSCPGYEFRGECHHIWCLRMTREWRHIRPKLEFMQPTPVSRDTFYKMMDLNTFVLQLNYDTPRHWMCLSRVVFLDDNVAKDIPVNPRLAGTVLEVYEGKKTQEKQSFIAVDCLYYRGFDYRDMPLRERLFRLSDVMANWEQNIVQEAPVEFDVPFKRHVARWSGEKVVLKDICSTYEQHPRSWLIIR